MKVRYLGNGFLIVPETDFERDLISGYYGELKSFLKTGLTSADIVGIKVTKDDGAQTKQAQ